MVGAPGPIPPFPAFRGATRRIALVAPQPFYQDRGTPIAVRQLLAALAQLGHEVDVITYPIGRSVDFPGVRYIRCANPLGFGGVPVGFSFRKLVLDVPIATTLRRQLATQPYDLIHAVEEAAFPAVVLGRRHKVPVIYDMQSSLPEQLVKHAALRNGPAQAMLHACERWLLRRADAVVSSKGLASRVRRMVPEARVHEWRYASEITDVAPRVIQAERRALGIPDGASIVLYSGTFEPYQGLPDLLRAVPGVLAACPSARVVLVGAEGEAGTTVRELARTLGVSDQVLILSRQPRERMPIFHTMADVLVSARRYGGNLPLKIFDYLAAGRPIVATDIPTHRTLLDESRALLVSPNSEELCRAIVRLLTDRDEAARLAAAARSYAQEHLGWRAFVQSVDELVATVCDSAPPRARR